MQKGTETTECVALASMRNVPLPKKGRHPEVDEASHTLRKQSEQARKNSPPLRATRGRVAGAYTSRDYG